VQTCLDSGNEWSACGCIPSSPGCDGASFRELPDDPGQRGPWPVGARTITADGLTFEAWYPAEPGSQQGVDPLSYDIRDQLPASEASKIPDAENPLQLCDCYRDLPPDLRFGPYPLLVFVHGTAGFRSQSLPQMTHWASRGFVVLAADHPGLKLGDLLTAVCGGEAVGQDFDGDVATMLSVARGEQPGLEFLAEALDPSRIGLAGHSRGGGVVGGLADIGQVIVPMAAGGVDMGSAVQSVLVMGGTVDEVVNYQSQIDGFEASPSPKRLVGLDNAGHLAFANLCSLTNAAGDDLLTIALDNGVCGVEFADALFQCGPELLPDAQAWEVIDYATTAAFEETLQCRPTTAFDTIESRFEAVAEFRAE
jgi:hypothetical protein